MAFSNKVILGDKMLLKVNGVALGCSTSHSIEVTSAEIDVTCKDNDGYTDTLVGLKSWSISADGFVNLGDPTKTGYEELYDLWASDTPITVISEISEGSNTFTLTGTAIITALPLSASVGDKVTYSLSLKGTGQLTKVNTDVDHLVTITAVGADTVVCQETNTLVTVVADTAYFNLPDGVYNFTGYNATLSGVTSVSVTGAPASGTITLA
jgi:TP901-1 family phage major tail protein